MTLVVAAKIIRDNGLAIAILSLKVRLISFERIKAPVTLEQVGLLPARPIGA